jgi:phage tail-like protein
MSGTMSSGRGTPEGLASPLPLAEQLPGQFQDDGFVPRFTDGLDVVLAPIMATLDSIDAYVDPMVAPMDFVAWLAGWVGVELDRSWNERRQRALVARAAELFAWRGTARGLAALVEVYTGVRPEIIDNGGTAWTDQPGARGEAPGSPQPWLVVRVALPPGAEVDSARLHRLVASAKPAHVPHRIDLVAAEPTEPEPPRKRRPERRRPKASDGEG